MNPHRILYFHPSNELYGADRSLLRLVRALDKDKYAPYVVVPNDLSYEGLLTRELQKNNIPFKEVKLGVLRRKYFNMQGIGLLLYRSIASAIQLAKFARKENFSLIHSNSTAVITGGLVSRLTGIPHIWHVREIITQPVWLNKVVANNLNLFSDKVVTVSGPTKQSLTSAQQRLVSKTVVVHNGIDLSRFNDVDVEQVQQLRQKWGVTTNDIIIGMVGRISAWKGQDFLVRAALPALKKYANTKLILVGSSVPGEIIHKNNLLQLIAEAGMSKRVIIEDFRSDIPSVLSAFNIFVLPSTRPDPFPTVVLEAMAAGKPVIATAHGGAMEQVEDGITGLLVSPSNSAEMTVALEKLIDEQELRRKMGYVGQKRALTCFTMERYVNDIENLYQHTLKK